MGSSGRASIPSEEFLLLLRLLVLVLPVVMMMMMIAGMTGGEEWRRRFDRPQTDATQVPNRRLQVPGFSGAGATGHIFTTSNQREDAVRALGMSSFSLFLVPRFSHSLISVSPPRRAMQLPGSSSAARPSGHARRLPDRNVAAGGGDFSRVAAASSSAAGPSLRVSGVQGSPQPGTTTTTAAAAEPRRAAGGQPGSAKAYESTLKGMESLSFSGEERVRY